MKWIKLILAIIVLAWLNSFVVLLFNLEHDLVYMAIAILWLFDRLGI